MFDIMDMEDIFYDIILEWVLEDTKKNGRIVAKRLIKEVVDFVDCQKNIACNNCKGKKFKTIKEAWQAM